MSQLNLEPCPFCGGKASIATSDSESNQRNTKNKDKRAEVSFYLTHPFSENEDCPIATYSGSGGILGIILYESREEAVKAWNKRHNK